MKYSLVSREVIADCITETAVQGQWMDGVVVIGGCDKNMPGGMIGLARMNVPGIYVLRRHDPSGQLEGQGSDHRVVVRGGRRIHRRAACRRKTSRASRRTRARRLGSCGGMCTANIDEARRSRRSACR